MSTRQSSRPSVIVHENRQYTLASTARRWWARIIDAILIIVGATLFALLGYASASVPSDALGSALVGGIIGYVLTTILLGLLYGWGAGLGQLMTGVKSRRTRDGRRVGGFRGVLRYLGIAFLPFAIYLLFDAPTFWHDDIVVFERTGQLVPPDPRFQRDPQRDARFASPDPYQNGAQFQRPTH